jgi:hypothetical protein
MNSMQTTTIVEYQWKEELIVKYNGQVWYHVHDHVLYNHVHCVDVSMMMIILIIFCTTAPATNTSIKIQPIPTGDQGQQQKYSWYGGAVSHLSILSALEHQYRNHNEMSKQN